ncbi:hypothetical protein IscW_ISCW002747 [Ixodes scapularis]|uniref:Uncharacterized protein n=1 Tax=Ixodes scapularis TaxID=6945 RepID=B7PDS7_IXOSC|nr:hypothetical protein IscW_ISCW002747 [Ixodes scapularis]|eukprot:XP_002411039.1 hypothetical protein IscW_ISCW002747 [Ixodes scapularis]
MLEVASPTRVQPPRLEANGTSGRRESPARGPQWPGHRTFLSIYNEDHGRLFNGGAETSGCLSDAQGGGIAWLWMAVWCNCFIYMGISLQGITFTGLLSVIYPAYLLILGMVLHAAAIAALGALHWLPDDENLFLGVSAAIKCVAGIGFAIYFATMYTTLFYKNQQSYLATLVWLYPLPYFAIGGCMLLGILIAVALPLDACVPRDKFSEAKNDCSSLSFLGDVRFWVDIVTAALAGATIAHFETTLELHLSVITESEYHINYSYAIIYGCYAIGAVLFGFTSSLPKVDAFVVFVAQLISAVAFLFVGPAHFLPIPT